jgi:protein MpaA
MRVQAPVFADLIRLNLVDDRNTGTSLEPGIRGIQGSRNGAGARRRSTDKDESRFGPAVAVACLVLLSGVALTSSSAATTWPRPLSALSLAMPTTRYLIGYSVDRRPIVAWLLAPSHAHRSVLVIGSIAGDEPGGVAVANVLASGSAVAGVRLWVIPDANPDGIARGTRVNAAGVDLNRNFPFRWRHFGSPGNRFYSGPHASSEPESRAVEAFIRRARPGLSIWLHQPYGLIDDSEGPRWAERQLARALELPMERLRDYPGSAIGWNDHLVPASAFDVELPGGATNRRDIGRIATAIRSLARRFSARRSVR